MDIDLAYIKVQEGDLSLLEINDGLASIKVLILFIEDNRLLQEGISALLKKQSDMNVVTTIGNGENFLATSGI